MKFVIADSSRDALRNAERCISSVFAGADTALFTDALSAYKYCVNNSDEICVALISVLLRPFDGLKLGELLSRLSEPISTVMMISEDSRELRALIALTGSGRYIVKPITNKSIADIMSDIAGDCASGDCDGCAINQYEGKIKLRA
jgi:DNA-binding response OmpR family regulator